jgi:hypothetical protein
VVVFFSWSGGHEAERNTEKRMTMLDLGTEHILRLAEATQHLPLRRRGKQTHPATLYRWAKYGVRGIRLETIRVGGTLCTSLEALQRFCDRLTGDEVVTIPSKTPTVGSRVSRRTRQVLDRLGF